MSDASLQMIRRAAAVLLAAWFAVAPAAATEPWGYEVPVFGADTMVIGVYRSQAGAIVLEFAHGSRNARMVGFYDTTLKKRLGPDQPQPVGGNAAQNALAATLNLTPVDPQDEVTNSAGTHFALEGLAGTACLWPYDGAMKVTPAGTSEPRLSMVAWKLPRAEAQAYGCSYATDLQDVKLRARFHEEDPHYFWSAGPDVFAVFAHRYLVRFDANGGTHFFDHRKDAVMVPAARIAPLVAQIKDAHTAAQAQALVNRIEGIVAAGVGK